MTKEQKNNSMTFKQFLINLLLFKYGNINYNKAIKISMSLILWADVIGLIILIWLLVDFYIKLWSIIMLIKDLIC